jgi:hypothetical protein
MEVIVMNLKCRTLIAAIVLSCGCSKKAPEIPVPEPTATQIDFSSSTTLLAHIHEAVWALPPTADQGSYTLAGYS